MAVFVGILSVLKGNCLIGYIKSYDTKVYLYWHYANANRDKL